jgi:aromatase
MLHTHRAAVDPQVLYDLVADVTRWPVLFGPTLHVDVLERSATGERFRLWALVGGEAKSWTSRRTFDPDERRITFEQEQTQAPIASMGGAWRFRSRVDGTTDVELEHMFTAVGADDDPGAADRLGEAVDRNSQEELANLARLAELGPADELVFGFEDVMPLPVPAAEAYDFVNRADLWPDRLPHVGRVELTESQPGVQDMEMDTVTSEGSRHTTRSIRLCFPSERIVYKQLVPPALLLGHSGSWAFAPAAHPDGSGAPGAVVTARHTVAIDPGKVEPVLGPGRTLDDARTYLRDALGANSRATLSHAGGVGASP